MSEMTETPTEDEVTAFVLHEQVVTTIDGETIKPPRCSWGMEQQIIAILKDVIKSVAESGLLNGDQSVAQATSFLIAALFETAPEKLEQAVCILTNKDRAWVQQHLDMEEMLKLVLPFLSSKRQRIALVLKPYAGKLPFQMPVSPVTT